MNREKKKIWTQEMILFALCVPVIGGWGNTRVIIRRKQGADVLRETQVVDLLSNDKWIAFLIQITTRTYKTFCQNPFFFLFFFSSICIQFE